jgi:hypothetical protein
MHSSDVPCWFWVIYVPAAVAWSAYRGYRGAVEQRAQHQERERLKKIEFSQADTALVGELAKAHLDYKPRSRQEQWVVLYIQDAAFRFLCTMAGSIALVAAYFIADSLSKQAHGFASASPAAATLLVLAFLIGVIGVGGQLHYVILVGKWPRS